MALAAALPEPEVHGNDNSLSSRGEVLARYRQLREISKRHHHEVMKHISGDTMLHQARRLGLARGKTLILGDMEEMNYVFDLAIHTAPAGRSRAIDRYARSARLAAPSDETLVLEAMPAARFSILAIERRHETAGLIATDLFRRATVWLVDLGLESSMPDGGMIATRLFTPDRFAMTAGVIVPFEPAMIEELHAELPRKLSEIEVTAVIDDRRFAETIYRIALADGVMNRIAFQDLPDDPDQAI
jgi:hypothetical protein